MADTNTSAEPETPPRLNHKVIRREYFAPPCVTEALSMGSTSHIGKIDEQTVLKYPHLPIHEDLHDVEATIYEELGPHPHILEYHGRKEGGIILELAPNGNVAEYLQEHPGASEQQRLTWCRQFMDAVVHIHSKRVIHCNLSATNLLIDKYLIAKLADFQGILHDAEGAKLVSGDVIEPARWRLPSDDYELSYRSDLFAAGSTMYEIMAGHTIFPEFDIYRGDDDDEIERRFKALEFPDTSHLLGGEIINKCWHQQYTEATECLRDLEALEQITRM